ncbi:MAG: mechanosensitive ion channel family protein [Imperialibacter sp.]|uniref:mechanosensitive ion channel family protein n=1 Tax=Imperialibacter sp. TaxID=2038411 RepID=UPI0030D862BA|tara:strand:- start:63235 stop:64152 length:918 start_codon:yes stop_codon:yes gene_type:complete
MEITEWFETNWNVSPETQLKIVYSVLSILILAVLRVILFKILFNKITDPKERYYWKNVIKNSYYALVLLVIGSIWIDKLGSLATFFGLVTAGLAIALQDPIVNLAGWLFILLRKPFEVGDRVEISGVAGDVIDIRFFQFTLNEIKNWVDADQSTGRIVHIPNGKVFKEVQANYNQGFSHIWNEIGVLVTFESNWEKAKSILEAVLSKNTDNLSQQAERKLIEASKKFMILYTTLTPVVYVAVKDSGVMLSMRYLVSPKNRRDSEHKIWQDVLRQFSESNDIDFAYPTQRVYFNPREGKPQTGKSH